MGIRNLLMIAATLFLVACASTTKIVPAGKDTYVIAGEDDFEATSGSSIKTTLYEKANSYCEEKGKKLQPLNESVSSYSAELRFRCLEEGDPEYIRPIMESVPNIKIESR